MGCQDSQFGNEVNSSRAGSKVLLWVFGVEQVSRCCLFGGWKIRPNHNWFILIVFVVFWEYPELIFALLSKDGKHMFDTLVRVSSLSCVCNEGKVELINRSSPSLGVATLLLEGCICDVRWHFVRCSVFNVISCFRRSSSEGLVGCGGRHCYGFSRYFVRGNRSSVWSSLYWRSQCRCGTNFVLAKL